MMWSDLHAYVTAFICVVDLRMWLEALFADIGNPQVNPMSS